MGKLYKDNPYNKDRRRKSHKKNASHSRFSRGKALNQYFLKNKPHLPAALTTAKYCDTINLDTT